MTELEQAQKKITQLESEKAVLVEALRKTIRHLPTYENKLDAAFGGDPSAQITSVKANALLTNTAQQSQQRDARLKTEWREAVIEECVQALKANEVFRAPVVNKTDRGLNIGFHEAISTLSQLKGGE